MGAWDAVKAATGLSGAWARSLLDILPPYRVADGIIERKEAGEDGAFRIVVNGASLSVDAAAFRLLQPGDRVAVRHTARMNRAISVTRYTERGGRRDS